MINSRLSYFALLVAIPTFINGFAPVASAAERCEDFGLTPIGFFIEGIAADEYIAERRGNFGATIKFLQELGITNARGNLVASSEDLEALTAILRSINAAPATFEFADYTLPDAMLGLGGFITTHSLQRLLPVDINEPPIADKILYGKIRDYIFIQDGEAGSGHLSVDTCTEDIKTYQRDFYHWDVSVEDGGFRVTERDDANPTDPFSDADFTLPAAALDPNNEKGIWKRGLNHKLGAKGMTIKVQNVYHRVLATTGAPVPLTRFDSDHHHYKSTESSCIDLLTEGYPPATFGKLVGNDYCLGRCSHPAIFNSGE